MKDFPIYAPIKKTFSFDKSKMIDEIDKFLLPFVEERTLPFKNGRSIYDQDGLLNIASDEDLQNTSKYYLDENEIRVPVSGKFKTYQVINLTHLLEEEDSLIDIYKTTDAKKKIFWHTYKKAFKWRDTLENSYIKQVVEQFPWEYVQGVRLIYMSPPSIGQIHRDSNPLDNYKYFVVSKENIVIGGYEFKSDAKDLMDEFNEDGNNNYRILNLSQMKKEGLL
jgi:hypothetical protein